MREFEVLTLPNGIRVVHKQVFNTAISHSGFILDIGSRDENEEQEGLAHFWEHMAFKGTQRRKAYHILSRLDSVGGELNAYTTKEKICFYASVLNKHFEKAAELLTDITFFSTFPEREIKKEKGVILEEMAMYLDDPSDAIQDHFDQVVFGEHPLGKNILGTQESVSNFEQGDFLRFVNGNINTEEIIFVSVSSLPVKQVFKTMQKFLAEIPVKNGHKERKRFDTYKPQNITESKPIGQAHCVLGSTAFSLFDEKRFPFFMLVNLLGGPAMNSRLNLAIREKYGFVYSIDANFHSYVDTGAFSIQFATEKKTLDRCVGLVFKELEKLKTQALGTRQLHNAKEQLMGQLAMSEESNLGLMLLIGKSLLDLNRVDPLEVVFDKIRTITPEDIMDLSNEVFDRDKISVLTYMPEG